MQPLNISAAVKACEQPEQPCVNYDTEKCHVYIAQKQQSVTLNSETKLPVIYIKTKLRTLSQFLLSQYVIFYNIGY